MWKENSLNERLKLIRSQLGYSQQRLADTLGIKQASYAVYETGQVQPGADKLVQLHEQFGVNLHWLLTGEGQPYTHSPVPVKKSITVQGDEPRIELLPVVVDRDDQPLIKVVTLEASAGYFSHREDSAYWENLPSISLPDPHFRQGTFLGFPVRGDSMEPTLAHGDLVVCRFMEHWRLLKPGYVHVVALENDLLVKRIRFDEGQRTFTLLSDNPFYPPMQLAATDVRQLWEVEIRITLHMPAPRSGA